MALDRPPIAGPAGAGPAPRALPDGLVAGVLAATVAVLGFRLGAGSDALAAAVAGAAVLIGGCPIAVACAAAAVRHAGGRLAARLGLGLRAPELVALGRVDTVLLPRTGVLTVGVGELRGATAVDGVTPQEVLRLAAAVERPSAHVLARALTAAAGPDVPGVADFDRLPGRGVRGVVSELSGDRVLAHAVLAGSAEFLLDHGIALPPELAAARAAAGSAGQVAVAVAWDGSARGVLAVEDPERQDTPAALAVLRGLGVRPVLVTNAGPAVAAALADRLGFGSDEVITGDPAAAVRRLRAEARTVAGSGTELDFTVGATGLGPIVDAVRLARRMQRVTTAARATAVGVAGAGALAATAGLLDQVTALSVPATGLFVLACARLAVVRLVTWGARGVTALTGPVGATCG
jgi:cation transport ATPase